MQELAIALLIYLFAEIEPQLSIPYLHSMYLGNHLNNNLFNKTYCNIYLIVFYIVAHVEINLFIAQIQC